MRLRAQGVINRTEATAHLAGYRKELNDRERRAVVLRFPQA